MLHRRQHLSTCQCNASMVKEEANNLRHKWNETKCKRTASNTHTQKPKKVKKIQFPCGIGWYNYHRGKFSVGRTLARKITPMCIQSLVLFTVPAAACARGLNLWLSVVVFVEMTPAGIKWLKLLPTTKGLIWHYPSIIMVSPSPATGMWLLGDPAKVPSGFKCMKMKMQNIKRIKLPSCQKHWTVSWLFLQPQIVLLAYEIINLGC